MSDQDRNEDDSESNESQASIQASSYKRKQSTTPKSTARFLPAKSFGCTETALVRGGCTKFVQTPDVCWNSSFKAEIREFYKD
uniref:Uncharacterized protein n=1 Tax=Ditylenchus dipsaci TaxID=166011 RepID=A0A915D8N1_9BILA